MHIRVLGLAALITLPVSARAQAIPNTRAAAVAYDVEMVRRAAKLIDSPAHWDRDDSDRCPRNATRFSILCALQTTIDLAAAAHGQGRTGKEADCRFPRIADSAEGSCGLLFEELPIFTVHRVQAVATGRWRDDASPVEIWVGQMTDAAAPVLLEARRTVDTVTTRKYAARLDGYNRDSTTTFADVQHYFQVLEERVTRLALADFADSGDSVEVEIYSDGTGVIRTYAGWYPVSAFSASDGTVRFRVDTTAQVSPNALDRRIIQRAAAILGADSVWNRADNRTCPASAHTWSIYCAVQLATIEVAGAFHHRRPAAEVVRIVIEERTRGRHYSHRLMDYNNDTSTTLADVRSLFAEAIARIR